MINNETPILSYAQVLIIEFLQYQTGEGLGLRALTELPKGTLVADYRGAHAPYSKRDWQDFLATKSEVEKDAIAIYEFEFWLGADQFFIDASQQAADGLTLLGRLANYGRTPLHNNCRTFARYVHVDGSTTPALFLVTGCDIPTGHQIFFDYGPRVPGPIGGPCCDFANATTAVNQHGSRIGCRPENR